MDGFAVWLFLLAGYTFIGPVLGIWALRRLSRQQDELVSLRGRLEVLERGGASPAGPEGAAEARGSSPAPDREDQPAEQPEREPEADVPEVPAAAAMSGRLPEAGDPRAEPAVQPGVQPGAGTAVGKVDGLEQSLTSRWLVWLGGVTLALGGVFLVKYSVEQGWLGPLVRVLLGLLFGLALTVGGEALRRRPLQQAIAAIGPNYIPPALTAAGLAIAFVSLYAAFALYGLMNPLTAFVALAVLAAAAIALSLLQGPFIALLGLVGGYLTPALVATDKPQAWALFGYLLALTTAAMVLVRAKAWWWLGRTILAGASLWALVWLIESDSWQDSLPFGAYLVLAAALFLALGRHGEAIQAAERRAGWAGWLERLGSLPWSAALVFAVFVFLLVQVADEDPVTLGAVLAMVVLFLVAAWRDAALDGLLVLAVLLALAVVASWNLPTDFEGIAALYRIEGRDYGTLPGPFIPAGFEALAWMSLLFALLLGLGGQAGVLGAARPALWAGVSALGPVAILAIVYWRIAHLGLDLRWSALALALAAINLLWARLAARRVPPAQRDAVLGLTALGVSAAIALGAVMALEQAWLTVALSLQLPVLGWLHRRFGVAGLRHIALAIAAVVLIRLVFNPYILDYPFGATPGMSWVLYGYGIPAAAFWLAARLFGRTQDARLAALLEGGCLVFSFMLVSLEIRSLLGGTARQASDRLLEASLQSIAWLIMAVVVQRLNRREPRPVMAWGWRILVLLAAAQVVGEQLGFQNPLATARPVGGWLLFNVLALAYALPAVFAFFFARSFLAEGQRRLAFVAGVLGLSLLLVYISMEVRHAFHAPVLAGPWPEQAELYAYSLAWLLYSGALLALGIVRQVPVLRYASLAVLLVTVAKVFLLDLSDLTGLWRVASFVGLGLTLVGIGYLYQRFVFPPRRAGASPSAVPDPQRSSD